MKAVSGKLTLTGLCLGIVMSVGSTQASHMCWTTVANTGSISPMDQQFVQWHGNGVISLKSKFANAHAESSYNIAAVDSLDAEAYPGAYQVQLKYKDDSANGYLDFSIQEHDFAAGIQTTVWGPYRSEDGPNVHQVNVLCASGWQFDFEQKSYNLHVYMRRDGDTSADPAFLAAQICGGTGCDEVVD